MCTIIQILMFCIKEVFYSDSLKRGTGFTDNLNVLESKETL